MVDNNFGILLTSEQREEKGGTLAVSVTFY